MCINTIKHEHFKCCKLEMQREVHDSNNYVQNVVQLYTVMEWNFVSKLIVLNISTTKILEENAIKFINNNKNDKIV